MTYLLRLGLDRIRANVELTSGTPQSEAEVLRLLAAMGVLERDEKWFVARDSSLRGFLDGEVLDAEKG